MAMDIQKEEVREKHSKGRTPASFPNHWAGGTVGKVGRGRERSPRTG